MIITNCDSTVVSRVIRRATESGWEEQVRKFPFSSDSAYESVAYNLVKTRLLESEAEAEGSITMHVLTLCDWFSSSASACDSDNLVFISS